MKQIIDRRRGMTNISDRLIDNLTLDWEGLDIPSGTSGTWTERANGNSFIISQGDATLNAGQSIIMNNGKNVYVSPTITKNNPIDAVTCIITFHYVSGFPASSSGYIIGYNSNNTSASLFGNSNDQWSYPFYCGWPTRRWLNAFDSPFTAPSTSIIHHLAFRLIWDTVAGAALRCWTNGYNTYNDYAGDQLFPGCPDSIYLVGTDLVLRLHAFRMYNVGLTDDEILQSYQNDLSIYGNY